MDINDIRYALLCHKIERNTFLFNNKKFSP